MPVVIDQVELAPEDAGRGTPAPEGAASRPPMDEFRMAELARQTQVRARLRDLRGWAH